MSIEQIIRRGEYYFQVTLDGGGAVCLPETSGEDERRAEERDATNEGETRNEKKKTPHLCPEYQLHTGGMKMLPLGSSKSPQREKF